MHMLNICHFFGKKSYVPMWEIAFLLAILRNSLYQTRLQTETSFMGEQRFSEHNLTTVSLLAVKFSLIVMSLCHCQLPAVVSLLDSTSSQTEMVTPLYFPINIVFTDIYITSFKNIHIFHMCFNNALLSLPNSSTMKTVLK
jgi:hypothetical protein